MQTVTINQRLLAAVGLGTWHMGDDHAGLDHSLRQYADDSSDRQP